MAARVYMSAGIFKVSKPGKDARTATGQDLLFDSTTARLNGIFMHGKVPYTSFSETQISGPYPGYLRRTFNLSYDSGKYPRFAFWTQDASSGIIRPTTNFSDFIGGDGATTGTGAPPGNRAYLFATASPISGGGGQQLNVYNYYTDASGQAAYSRLLNFYYLVYY